MNTQDEVLKRQLGVISNSFMSFGTFSTSIQGIYSWGVLRSAQFAGMVMDIDRIGAIIVDKDNKQSNLLAFTQQQGPRQSLNENLVSEQFFNDPNSVQKNVEGVSATKILKLTNDQGQKIYQIDQLNFNTILPQLNHESQVITDIRNAVAAGKVVTTSEKSINFNGWKGSGYIITDPNSGSGAYMISGGFNGGAISMPPAYSIFFAIAAIAFVVGLFVAGTVLAIALLLLAIVMLGCGLANYTEDGIYGDWAALGVGIVISLLGSIATSGASIATVIGIIISGAFVGTRFSTRCVEA
ncbi:hypothetical protein [Acinetobacter venetianus]|uniref:Uncharacterized protein n=1 Tax=Acinetobacter venetianus TaxID=52133 RepID=A0A150HR35_9GAMM|nr:hypothetical protein [Acinetobacter venetianus]KXZ69132.1 hypothetical protein AVENLUH13518_02668 [Acinetobacter venetianus]